MAVCEREREMRKHFCNLASFAKKSENWESPVGLASTFQWSVWNWDESEEKNCPIIFKCHSLTYDVINVTLKENCRIMLS